MELKTAFPRTRKPRTLEWACAIHGGAGAIPLTTPEETVKRYREALAGILAGGIELLSDGAAAIEVVEALVTAFEDNELFNAGRGAVYTSDARHELDAAIMDGLTGRSGSVAGVRRVRNPVRLARAVLDSHDHMFYAGEGADRFAETRGLDLVENGYFDTAHRYRALCEARGHGTVLLDHDQGYGTVGAVVRDRTGNLAAATSTGGMTNKAPGRVGDTPLIGAGTYAANGLAAVSATGRGEAFMRHMVAYDLCARIRYCGTALEDAAHDIVMNEMKAGDGGIIAVDHAGTIVMPFNSPGMYRAAADSSGDLIVAIWDSPEPTSGTR